MAIERRNPVPPGWYWQDIFRKDAPGFNDWLRRHKGKVFVRKTTTGEPMWVLFEVRTPVVWEGPGLPTIADKEERTELDDVIEQRREPDPVDTLVKNDAPGTVQRYIRNTLIFGGIVGTAYLFADLWWKHTKPKPPTAKRVVEYEE